VDCEQNTQLALNVLFSSVWQLETPFFSARPKIAVGVSDWLHRPQRSIMLVSDLKDCCFLSPLDRCLTPDLSRNCGCGEAGINKSLAINVPKESSTC
jgi:hypothetical protein